jgi:hypothetical protein
MHAELYLHCSTCAAVRLTETPPCADGHGYDCPERACTECGTALIVGPTIIRERPRPAARRAA